MTEGRKRGHPQGRRATRRRSDPVHGLRVDSVAAGGEGVGRLEDGRVVFVHRTAPGDLVEVRLVHQQKRWARGRLVRILEPSPDRREPPCAFAAQCGGCTLEHVHYPAQLKAKSRIVGDALRRIGGFEIADPEVVPSPRERRYRNRLSFTLRRLGAGQVVAGFHALHEPDRLVDVDGRCLLPEEPVSEVWDRLRAAWGPDANRLPSGEQLRLTLRATSGGLVSLLIEGGFATGRPEELVGMVAGLAAVWHRPGAGPARLLAGEPGLEELWGDETVEVGGTTFLQVNRTAAALLEAHVLELVGSPAGLDVIDAYCGVGVHARRLARAGARVTGLELDSEAVRSARAAAVPGAHFLEGDVAEVLPSVLPADLVILNPPRAGIDPLVVDALIAAPPARLIYVSCDPATLARDLARLAAGFGPEHVRCFDLFPQTAHVETVASMRRL